MSGRETADVSKKQRGILEYQAARRTRLRSEYLEQIGNPYRMAASAGGNDGGTMLDLGGNRFLAMRATASEHFRPNPRNTIFLIISVIIPITLASYGVFGSRDRKEQEYRTGKISYRDREFKFT